MVPYLSVPGPAPCGQSKPCERLSRADLKRAFGRDHDQLPFTDQDMPLRIPDCPSRACPLRASEGDRDFSQPITDLDPER